MVMGLIVCIGIADNAIELEAFRERSSTRSSVVDLLLKSSAPQLETFVKRDCVSYFLLVSSAPHHLNTTGR
jgi:hypothetical protein